MKYRPQHAFVQAVRSLSNKARIAIVTVVFALAGLSTGLVVSSASAGTTPPPPHNLVTTVTALVPSGAQSITTGGSFSHRSTLLGQTVTLSPGTYLVSVAFKATPNAATPGAVFPQMMVYNGEALPDFSNNLFNVGAGALEQFTAAPLPSDLIDSYYNGESVITVPAGGETLDFYAFGYDSGGGSGSYLLDSATVSTVRLGS